MKFIILGSGGCQPIPRPCCQCRVCKEARDKGRPYSRLGPALFLMDINALFDTPEEICMELNAFDIKSIDHVFYTHWHPDHTAGKRVFEQLNLDWLKDSVSKLGATKTTPVYANKIIWKELNSIGSKFGSFFDYYKSQSIIQRKTLTKEPVKIKDIKISTVFIKEKAGDCNVLIYIIEKGNKKVIYAPCDCKPFPKLELLKNADVLIIWSPFFEGKLKDGFVICPNNPLKKELFSMDEIMKIIEEYKPKQTIITHIEEIWGKSYDDLKKIENKYKKQNLKFAYDGMKLKV